MKITAKFNTNLVDKRNHAHITFTVENYRNVMQLDELEENEYYAMEIKKRKSKRSLQQNAYLWALLHALEEASKQDVMRWYTFALEECNAKTEYLLGTDDIMDNLIKSFRAVRKVGKRMVADKELTMYKCYYGSSKFTVSEMNELLDKVIGYCHEYNIKAEEYRDGI